MASDFDRLYQATLDAFANYVVEYQPTKEALERMFLIENIDFGLSVGTFDGEEMVGFMLNGTGTWKDKKTIYDGATGVVPSHRNRGLSRRMFDFILPVLHENNFEQYLLEVITVNKPALRLYQSLGFEIQREVGVFRQKSVLPVGAPPPGVEIREMKDPDWKLLETFWTYEPSWQNSIAAMRRSFADDRIIKTILGLYLDDEPAGYGIVFHRTGNVPQLAVAKAHRGRGFGRFILNALQEKSGKPLYVLNVDLGAKEILALFNEENFELLTKQYEMLLELK